jgi:hypothetical protein
MAQRSEPRDSLDDFPTPPWATRALMEHVLKKPTSTMTCLEPACGAGHMARTLKEYFKEVEASDVHDYGYGAVSDFMEPASRYYSHDWVITNPPFRLAEKFITQSMWAARNGIAIFVRSVFIESVGRYNRLFLHWPPSVMAQFTERVPLVKGRLDKDASTATSYCWLVWDKHAVYGARLIWIPPCRKALEREGDYT